MDNGDIDESFYDSLCSMMSSIQKRLAPRVGIDAHADCARRLKVMDDMPDISRKMPSRLGRFFSCAADDSSG